MGVKPAGTLLPVTPKSAKVVLSDQQKLCGLDTRGGDHWTCKLTSQKPCPWLTSPPGRIAQPATANSQPDTCWISAGMLLPILPRDIFQVMVPEGSVLNIQKSSRPWLLGTS